MFTPSDPQLEEFLTTCQRVFERLEKCGKWPWPGSDPEGEATNNNSNHDPA